MRVGITVHAISTWLLPYTCAGSLPSSSGRFLNLMTAYTSSAQTHRKIAPVTPSTSVDNPKIAAAGVDAGAKMVVGLTRLSVCRACADIADGRPYDWRQPREKSGVEARRHDRMCQQADASPAGWHTPSDPWPKSRRSRRRRSIGTGAPADR